MHLGILWEATHQCNKILFSSVEGHHKCWWSGKDLSASFPRERVTLCLSVESGLVGIVNSFIIWHTCSFFEPETSLGERGAPSEGTNWQVTKEHGWLNILKRGKRKEGRKSNNGRDEEKKDEKRKTCQGKWGQKNRVIKQNVSYAKLVPSVGVQCSSQFDPPVCVATALCSALQTTCVPGD